jgi:hypothetical protein
MTPEFVFRTGNEAAIVGWLALILAGRFRIVSSVLCKYILPVMIAFVYGVLVVTHWKGHQGGFDSVTSVHKLFDDPWLLTAGWLHYLASDLFVGAWEVRDAQRSGISHWLVVPCLVMTFLFGPIGFLVFLLLKAVMAGTDVAKQRQTSLPGE